MRSTIKEQHGSTFLYCVCHVLFPLPPDTTSPSFLCFPVFRVDSSSKLKKLIPSLRSVLDDITSTDFKEVGATASPDFQAQGALTFFLWCRFAPASFPPHHSSTNSRFNLHVENSVSLTLMLPRSFGRCSWSRNLRTPRFSPTTWTRRNRQRVSPVING